jgi:hypothetical protein
MSGIQVALDARLLFAAGVSAAGLCGPGKAEWFRKSPAGPEPGYIKGDWGVVSSNLQVGPLKTPRAHEAEDWRVRPFTFIHGKVWRMATA